MSQVKQLCLNTPWVTQTPDVLIYSEEEPDGLEKAMTNEQKLSFQGRFLIL